MAMPAIATTLTGSGNECNEPILNTETGPATLRAQWDANTINLNWYSDDTLLDVQQSADTCVYDVAITLPSTNPTKTGYTFGGWRVRSSAFDPATLNATINGDAYYAHGWHNAADYCFAGADNINNQGANICTTEPQVSDLAINEWKIIFNYGTLKGSSLCSTDAPTPGHVGQTGTPDENSSGQYCWCKTTGFDAEKDGSYISVETASWVFMSSNSNATSCLSGCAYNCAYYARTTQSFRVALYGQSN